jgi:RNA polymerase sigma factor (TIGR02999 family)
MGILRLSDLQMLGKRGDGEDITGLLLAWRSGEADASDRLFALVYDELRRIAHRQLNREASGHTLDTTALVHESYLKFLNGGQLRAEDRRAFFAYASSIMRSVIIDTVRERQAERRGGGAANLTLSTPLLEAGNSGDDDVLRVHEALGVLAQAEPRLAQVVEMRYFGGYSETEIAEALDVTDRTVRRDWERARLLLAEMLGR